MNAPSPFSEDDQAEVPSRVVDPLPLPPAVGGNLPENDEVGFTIGCSPWMVLAMMVFVCILANALVPGLFWHHQRFGTYTEELAFLGVGGLVAQLTVLGVWCALGVPSLKVRGVATTGLAGIVCCSYVIGLQIPDFPTSSMPTWVALFIFGVGMGGFGIVTVGVLLVGWLTGETIRHRSQRGGSLNSQSFGIGYLIGLTTAIAVVVAAVQAVLPAGDQDRPPASEMWMVLLLSLQHTCYSLLLVVSCVWLVLRTTKNWHAALWLLALLIITAPANLMAMNGYRGIRVNQETVVCLWTYTIGLVLTTLLFLGVIRLNGYQLSRLRK